MAKIDGGYYLKARKIQNSKIAKASPHIREIWDWLLKEANHKDTNVCQRGQCVRSYKDIQEGLHWLIGWRKCTYSKDQCETAMKWLKKADMVTTRKTTVGMVITVLNYDYFQTPENYEENHKRTTREPQSRHTINKNEKNEKNIYNTIESVESLIPFFEEKYPRLRVAEEYEAIANWVHAKGKEKEYKDFKAMFNGCLLRKNKEFPEIKHKNFMISEEGYVET